MPNQPTVGTISPPPVPSTFSSSSTTTAPSSTSSLSESAPTHPSLLSALLPSRHFSGTHLLSRDATSTVEASSSTLPSSSSSVHGPSSTSPSSSTAVSSSTPGHTDYSERLSRKVLASLKSLNESLGEVRRSVAKIDSIAHHRLINSSNSTNNNGIVSPISPSSSSTYPNLGSPTLVTAAVNGSTNIASPVPSVRSLSTTFEAFTTAVPVPVMTIPPTPPSSSTINTAPVSTNDIPFPTTPKASTAPTTSTSSTITGMTPVSMHEAATLLRRVLLSPAFKGSGIDDNTLADLASVLSQEDMDSIRAHVAFRPSFTVPLSTTTTTSSSTDGSADNGIIVSPTKTERVRTPGSTHSGHSSRPHTPPPANWHTPGSGPRHGTSRDRSGNHHGSLSRQHSIRSTGSVHFGGEIEIPASDLDAAAAEMNEALVAEAQKIHEQEQNEGLVPTTIDAPSSVTDGDLDDDEEEEEEDVHLDHKTKSSGIRTSNDQTSSTAEEEDDDEDSEDGLLRHPSQRRPGGLVTGSRSKNKGEDGSGTYDNGDDSSDTDTDDFSDNLHPSSHNIDGPIITHHTSSNTALSTLNDNTIVPSLTKVPSGAEVTETKLYRDTVTLPTDTPVPIFTFTRYTDPLPTEIEDDNTDNEVPFHVDHITEVDFYTSEAEVVELRRAKEQMKQTLLVPSSSVSITNNEPSASSTSTTTFAKVGSRMLPPGSTLPDTHTIIDTERTPTVEDWNGGDANWPSVVGDERTNSGTSSRSRTNRVPKRYEAFALRIVYEAGRTGFEETKEFQASIGETIAGRFQVIDYLGSAAFSSALSCIDLTCGEAVCLKVIKNSKDFVDQSLDEIKLLRYINAQGDADAHNVLRLRDYFYHKEHLFLVTELLKDNLYEFQKYLMDNHYENYYTIPRIQRIARQVLEALAFIHSKGLIHCDLKPENILIKSYSKCDIKVIDFGSSCFITDTLSTYIQSRSYRAPEIILGLPYTGVIDVWSLGCILCEMYNGKVLFANDTVQTILIRMQSLFGPFPDWMLDKGKDVNKYFSGRRDGTVFQLTEEHEGYVSLFSPSRTSLRLRLQCDDEGFLDFLASLLVLDPNNRPTAAKALQHPWLQSALPFEPYQMPL